MHEMIAVLDFGSQYTQLIVRRVRAAQVYCELFPWNTPAEIVLNENIKGFILSGGPASVYAEGAPQIPAYVFDSGLPILGICYGMQALTHALGGKVTPAAKQEYGAAELITNQANPLIPHGERQVWMSHADRIEQPPKDFITLASSPNAPIAAIGNLEKELFGVQFHPEVQHTSQGDEILRRFVVNICRTAQEWTSQSIIQQAVQRIQNHVGDKLVMSAISGGVDSSVATSLVHKAVGDQLVAIFIENGLMRQGEREQVVATFQENLGVELVVVDASEEFLAALKDVLDPEEKRRIIGERFIRLFEAQAHKLGQPPFLVQGTIYPDVVESSARERGQVQRIKTHHNVGGLPDSMQFELIEPLRYLFKDEVRAIGEQLELSSEIVWRQPFPGPGLAVRCLGAITPQRLQRLRAADQILTDELSQAGLLNLRSDTPQGKDIAQAFAVLLPVQSVGVMGDQRTYQETIALRAVTTEDFMTADWARLPHDLLAQISNRIINEVDGVNRVVYDITSKPPATIEWE